VQHVRVKGVEGRGHRQAGQQADALELPGLDLVPLVAKLGGGGEDALLYALADSGGVAQDSRDSADGYTGAFRNVALVDAPGWLGILSRELSKRFSILALV
jgi:hypothetical protein